MTLSKKKKAVLVLIVISILGFLIPQEKSMPVENASKRDYHPKSFWYHPWGRSGTHKGVDIFAKKGANIRSSTNGIVIFSGEIKMGGKVVVVVGPKWKLHYFAHMDQIIAKPLSFVSTQDIIGTVGESGNAAGKQPHLHYSIMTLFPYFWQIDNSPQGWKKMIYLNPIKYIEN